MIPATTKYGSWLGFEIPASSKYAIRTSRPPSNGTPPNPKRGGLGTIENRGLITTHPPFRDTTWVREVQYWEYKPRTFSAEGRSCRTLQKREKGWRPRARLVTSHSGGPGTRSGGTMTPLPGAGWTGTGRFASSQETRTRGQKSPQRSAERRPRFSQEGRGKTEEGSAAWRSVPSLLAGVELEVSPAARGTLRPATGDPHHGRKPRRATAPPCHSIIPRRLTYKSCRAHLVSAEHADEQAED
jgi:hypothetical protein